MEWHRVVIGVLGGFLLGLIYFGGLWWTVRRLADGRRPELLMLSSFLLRMLIVLAGLYLISDGRFETMAASLPGILIARRLLLRRLTTQASFRRKTIGS